MSPKEEHVSGVHLQRRQLANSMFQAVARSQFSKVKFLLDNGVSVDSKNDTDQNALVTALYISDDEKRDKMFRYLVRRGVDCVDVDRPTGREVISWACYLGRPAQVRKVLAAAAGEVDLLRADNEGSTPLHHATKQGHLEVVKILVHAMNKYELSVDVEDTQGLTPYIYARRLGYENIAEALLSEGHASPRRFDSIKYRSVEDWALIGVEEKKERERKERQRQIAQFKIRGQLPKVEIAKKKKVPTATLR